MKEFIDHHALTFYIMSFVLIGAVVSFFMHSVAEIRKAWKESEPGKDRQ